MVDGHGQFKLSRTAASDRVGTSGCNNFPDKQGGSIVAEGRPHVQKIGNNVFDYGS